VLSFGAWAIPWPGSVYSGFRHEEPPSASSLALVGAWYACAAAGAWAGFGLGRRIHPIRGLDRTDDLTFYAYAVALGTAGVVVSYGIIAYRDLDALHDVFQDASLIELRQILGYEAGLPSLRYAAIVAGGIALYRIVHRRRVSLLDVLGVASLVAASALASRLSLLLALLLAVALLVRARPGLRVSVVHLSLAVVAFALVLTPLTYFRSANFYFEKTGTTNPFLVTLSETVAYLATPAQVSVGIGNHLARGAPRYDLRGTARPDELPSGTCGIRNGDLERSLAGWTVPPAIGNGFTRSREQPRTGRYSAKAVYRGRALLAHAPLAFTYGRQLIRLWVYVPRDFGPATIAVGIDALGATGRTTASLDPNRRDEWQLAELDFVPGQSSLSGALRVYVARGNPRIGGHLYIDDLTLETRHAARAATAAAYYLAPTYLPASFADVTAAENAYLCFVDVDGSYTANSTFALMQGSLGWLAYPFIAVIALGGAAVAGHGTRYLSMVCLAGYALIYCFAELWRTYLFNAGVIHFVVLTIVGIPIVHTVVSRARAAVRNWR
jgi:hypothetical protein